MATAFRAKVHVLSAAASEPAGTVVGDYELMLALSAAAGTPVPPAGWAPLATWNGTNSKFALWSIRRGAAAPSYTWTGGSGFTETSVLCWKDFPLNGTVVVTVNPAQQINPQNPDPPATPSVPGTVVIAIGGSWTGSVGVVWAPPANYTIREDGSGVGNDLMVADRFITAQGPENPGAFSNGSPTLDDVAAGTVALIPPQDPPEQPPLEALRRFARSMLGAEPQSATVTGPNAFVLTVVTGAYPYTGLAAGLEKASDLAVSTGAYAYTGISITLEKGSKIVATVGAYPYTGIAIGLEKAARLAASTGAYPYNGIAAGLEKGFRLIAASGAYAYAGNPAGLYKGSLVSVVVGNYPYNGIAATLTWSGAGAKIITVATGAYAYTGVNANLVYVPVAAPASTVDGSGIRFLSRAHPDHYASQNRLYNEYLDRVKTERDRRARPASPGPRQAVPAADGGAGELPATVSARAVTAMDLELAQRLRDSQARAAADEARLASQQRDDDDLLMMD